MVKHFLSFVLCLMLLLCALPAFAEPAADALELPGLMWESRMNLIYATGFSVDYYEGGYALINVKDSAQYLVVPEGMPVPEGLDAGIRVLQQPLDKIYLAATSAMALFDRLDALSSIRLVGTAASGWYIDNAVAAIENGDMLFSGKYSEPDYELMINEGCDLAIESTMIQHSPKVQEMIELLGIPVFIDRSSYENHPLGRTEWIKLYSVLVDKEEQAEEFFATQTAIIEELKDFENTEKTVAFFYISSDGTVNVRASWDYIASMIEIAGGRYIFQDLSDPESNRSTVSMTLEQFYAAAVNADYLIYNAAIDNPLPNVDALLAKSNLFADFKAVREGNVWCTGKYLYQATDIVGSLITDIHHMLTGEEEGMNFIYKLD
ncbi:MAG: ABC transporter substrate-binding protein [Aristaeellaceae bacterium]